LILSYFLKLNYLHFATFLGKYLDRQAQGSGDNQLIDFKRLAGWEAGMLEGSILPIFQNFWFHLLLAIKPVSLLAL